MLIFLTFFNSESNDIIVLCHIAYYSRGKSHLYWLKEGLLFVPQTTQIKSSTAPLPTILC